MIKTVWSITFSVSDLKRATRFYEDILGLEKKYEFPSYVGFECGGIEIGLIPKPKTKIPQDFSVSVQLLVRNVSEFCNMLKAKGVCLTNELHEETWGGKQATFNDPDGNVLEITQIDWKKYYEVSAKGATH